MWVRFLVFLLVGLTGLFRVTTGMAQSKPLDVDNLLPYTVSPDQSPLRNPTTNGQPTSFSSLTALTDKTRGGRGVEALNLYSQAVKPDDWHHLRQLRSLRLLSIFVSDTTTLALDSLLVNLSELPRLEALRISVVYAERPNRRQRLRTDTIRSSPTVSLAQSTRVPVAGFNALHVLRLSGDLLATQPILSWFSGHHRLQRVELWAGWELLQRQLPDNLNQLPHLTELAINGRGWQGWETAFRGLAGLHSLSLSFVSAGGPRPRSHDEGNPVIKANQQRHITDLNRGLAQLTGLEQLDLTVVTQVDQLRLGRLPTLTRLRLHSVTPGDSTFLGMGSLESLTFEECYIARLPTTICGLSRLRELKLLNTNAPVGDGPKTQIPACLGQLASLTALSITNHSIRYLPVQVGDLLRLQRVELTACGLDTLPLFLTHLPVIRYLDLRANALSTIADTIRTWRQLDTLLLSRNRLTTLPAFVPQLKQLRMLAIQANQLHYLPDRLGDLDSLRQLLIGDNALRALPPSLGRLAQLQRLTIGKNLLTELPAWLGRLTGLTELSCDLPLKGLPASLVKLKKLKNLVLRHTRLRYLPGWIDSFQQLTYLRLESDELRSLPERIGRLAKLEGLHITGQKLSRLPASMGQLKQLTTLALTGSNRQEGKLAGGSLIHLPASLVNCKGLYALTITDQPGLDVVGLFAQLARLPSLHYLDLTGNHIGHLPPMNWQALRWHSVRLASNSLRIPPVELIQIPDLQELHLQNNPLPESLNHSFHNHQFIQEALESAKAIR